MHKATTGSKVQVSGRRLRHIFEVLFNAEGGGRIGAEPVAAADRLVTAKVPEGAATGRPKVVDSYGQGARSPKTLWIVGPGQIQSGSFKLRDASAQPRRSYYFGFEAAARDLHVHEQRAHPCADRRGQARDGHGGGQLGGERPGAERDSHGQMGRDPGRQAGSRRRLQVPGRPREREHGVDIRCAVPVPPLQVPDSGPALLRRRDRRPPVGPHPPGPGPLRPLHHSAGGSPRRPGPMEGLPLKRRLLPGIDRRRPATTTSTCT